MCIRDRCVCAVSYTHLDVYKRQTWDCPHRWKTKLWFWIKNKTPLLLAPLQPSALFAPLHCQVAGRHGDINLTLSQTYSIEQGEFQCHHYFIEYYFQISNHSIVITVCIIGSDYQKSRFIQDPFSFYPLYQLFLDWSLESIIRFCHQNKDWSVCFQLFMINLFAYWVLQSFDWFVPSPHIPVVRVLSLIHI